MWTRRESHSRPPVCETGALLLSYGPKRKVLYTFSHLNPPMTELIFLGTGGGRFAMITQRRATGGFRLNLDKFKIHVDPGPGAIVRSIQNKQNPQNLNCIIVTHAHPDHATDYRDFLRRNHIIALANKASREENFSELQKIASIKIGFF